jgi:hypothetical protein
MDYEHLNMDYEHLIDNCYEALKTSDDPWVQNYWSVVLGILLRRFKYSTGPYVIYENVR